VSTWRVDSSCERCVFLVIGVLLAVLIGYKCKYFMFHDSQKRSKGRYRNRA
jgi:hypothetical protein